MSSGARFLIVNADDAGASAGVNRGILEAHEHGIVTSTSLMVDMPGAEEFAARREEAPGLSVGLHVQLTDEEGELRFKTDAVGGELERQLVRFELLMGRAPTHLDSHHNVHLLGPLSELFGAVARERVLPLRGFSPARYYADFYGQWEGGKSHPELVGVEALIETLEREAGPGITELGCHPGYAGDNFESSYLLEREVELRSLCEPRVRQRARELGIELISFAQLDGASGGRGD